MKLLRVAEVALILDVPTARAYELARTGVLPVVRVGRQVRVDGEKLREWIDDGGTPLPGVWRREGSD